MTDSNGQQLVIGLIGFGIWGELVLRDLATIGVRAVVCDTDGARRAAALAGGAHEFHTSLDAMPDVDGWVIATPASDHARTVAALDERGNRAPLFVEKPLAASAEDADRLVTRSGPPIFVMHIWTYHAGIRKLKTLLASGLIGAPTMLRSTRVNWTSPRTDVDCIGNLAPHDLSIFHFLLGRLPALRYALAETLAGRCVSCVAALQDEGGPPCVLEVSNRYGEKRREFRIHGEQGVLVLPGDDAGTIILIKGEGFILPERLERFDYQGPPALQTELHAFVSYLEGEAGDALWDVETGAEVVRATEQIRSAAQQGVVLR